MKLLVINGPNINLLGVRERRIYGTKSYRDLLAYIMQVCHDNDIYAECFQSNHEGDIVDKIQTAIDNFDAIVINAAGYTHTSIAIMDALKAIELPAVEVHLTDIEHREEFRHNSYVAQACLKSITGAGFEGYRDAILFLKEKVEK